MTPEAVPEGARLALAALFGAGGLGGFWAWLRARPAGKADIQTSQAEFQKALTEQARLVFDELRETITGLEKRLIDVEADNRRCHSENRNLRAMLAALMRQLRAAGIDLPPDLQVAAILETETADGALTAFSSIPKKAAS